MEKALVRTCPDLTLPARIHVNDKEARTLLSRTMQRLLDVDLRSGHKLVCLCIGTDRSTGDSLGPLVGTKLLDAGFPEGRVFGTLNEPVHAANLTVALQRLYRTLESPFVIAVDACLGRSENVGQITVARGPLRPGTGVNKALPAVGNLHITGIVNVAGYMEYLVLQNTRLSLVMQMAEAIAGGIIEATHLLISREERGTGSLPQKSGNWPL